MADEVKEQVPPPGNEQDVLAKLNRLEEALAKNRELRNKRALITKIGIVLLLLAIGLFAFNLYSFYTNYDRDELFREAQSSMGELAQGPEVKALVRDIRETSLPRLKDELLKKLKEDQGQFEKEGVQVAKNLQHYLENDIKDKVLREVTHSIQEIERDLLSKYPDISPEEMDEVVKEAQAYFVNEITKSLETRIDLVQGDLALLHESFDKLKETEDFKRMDPKKTVDVSDEFVECMIELTLYQWNPKRGNVPAFPKGGAK